MSEVRKLVGLQEMDCGRRIVIAIVAISFVVGLFLGAFVGYDWGREDATAAYKKQLHQQDKEKTT